MIKVAVVILNWNGKSFLERFLDNVIRYSSGSNCKVYVADNGSTDNSAEYVRDKHPGAVLIELGKNYGFAGGYNEALKQVEAEYYVLINSDIEVSPGWIDPLVDYLDRNSDVAAVQPKILDYNNRDKFEYAGAAGGFIDKYGYPFCRGRIMNITEADKGQYDNITQIFWSSGACMLIRSSVWKDMGGFDPGFFAHMEEIDLCWKINSSGKKIMFIPASRVYHVGGGTLKYDSPQKIYLNFRNNLFLLYKNLPEERLKKTMRIRMLLDGIAALRFLFTFRLSGFINIFKAHFHYYRQKKYLKIQRAAARDGHNSYPSDLILNKSLVYSFYIRGIKTYSQISQD